MDSCTLQKLLFSRLVFFYFSFFPYFTFLELFLPVFLLNFAKCSYASVCIFEIDHYASGSLVSLARESDL